MNGTTRCPLCDTRFKITQAQLNAHGGMVRCGHCHGAFDARTGYTPDQPAEHAAHEAVADQGIPEHATDPDQAIPERSVAAWPDQAISEHAAAAGPDRAIPEHAAESEAEVQSPVDSSDISGVQHESLPQQPHESPLEFEIDRAEPDADAADILHAAETEGNVEATPADIAPQIDIHDTPRINPDAHPVEHIVMLDEDRLTETASSVDAGPEHLAVKRRRWPWLAGIGISLMLLLAQSAYLFRVELAAHLPALKPALIGICDALGCSVPLPKDVDAITIESSGLDADPLHENIITLNALLRNRAAYALAFPSIALTLNDNHDKLLARRLILPAEYLPSGEKEMSGFAANHEIIVKLRLDTADLKPSGYRIELFYGRAISIVTSR